MQTNLSEKMITDLSVLFYLSNCYIKRPYSLFFLCLFCFLKLLILDWNNL